MPRTAGRDHLRMTFGLLVAMIALMLAAPPEWVPWNRTVRTLLVAERWPVLAVTVSLLLVLATRLLPRTAAPTLRPGPQWTAITVGLLFLLEPLVHLAVLAFGAWHATSTTSDAVFPATLAPVIGWVHLPQVLAMLVLVPLAEEYFFRHRLLFWLRQDIGGTTAALVSTLAFATAHGDLVQMLAAFSLGLLLSWARLRGAPLGACIIAHALHNALFLWIGPAVITAPWVPLVMAACGVAIAGIAWSYLRPRAEIQHRRMVAVVLIPLLLIVLAAPLYVRAKEALWLRAAHRTLVYWRIPNTQMLARIELLLRHGRLPASRASALVARLRERPCQTATRQALLLARLGDDPIDDDAALADGLLDIAAEPNPVPLLVVAARVLALRAPAAFADAVFVDPGMVARWYPLPQAHAAMLEQVMATSGFRSRKLLLTTWERDFPGQVAPVLLRLPAACVTPADRRHLRFYYPDADARVAALAARDPVRARAWGP